MSYGRPKEESPRTTRTIRWTKEEYASVKTKAKAHSMDVSSYVRKIALGRKPKTTMTQQALAEVIRAHSNMTKTSHLVPLLLAEIKEKLERSQVKQTPEITRVLENIQLEIGKIRAQLREDCNRFVEVTAEALANGEK